MKRVYVAQMSVSIHPARLASLISESYSSLHRAVQHQRTVLYHYFINRMMPRQQTQLKPVYAALLLASGGHIVRTGRTRSAAIFVKRAHPVYIVATPRAWRLLRVLGEGG